MNNSIMSIEDVSDYLGVPVNTLYRWRTTGYGPAGKKVGKHVKYRRAVVDAWFDAQETA